MNLETTSRERIVPDVVVARTEGHDEVENVLSGFVSRLREENSDLKFSTIIDEQPYEKPVLYTANAEGRVLGVVLGERTKEGGFWMGRLLVDPHVENTNVISDLMNHVKSEYATIALSATSLLKNANDDPARDDLVLERYYRQKHGFTPDGPLMVWHRKDNI